jgi:hypothetical protein
VSASIPPKKLVRLGYARTTADGVAITRLGLATLAANLQAMNKAFPIAGSTASPSG